MKWILSLGTALWIGLLTLALGLSSAAAAGPPSSCSAGLVIFTTSPGTITRTGEVVHARDSGVGGTYTSGFLAGYSLSGSQDIILNTRANEAQLHGSFVATGPEGTLTIRYTGHADLERVLLPVTSSRPVVPASSRTSTGRVR